MSDSLLHNFGPLPDDKDLNEICTRHVTARLPELDKDRKRASWVEFFLDGKGKIIVGIGYFIVFVATTASVVWVLDIVSQMGVLVSSYGNLLFLTILPAVYLYHRLHNHILGSTNLQIYREAVADLILEAVAMRLKQARSTDRMDAFTRVGFDFTGQANQSRHWFRGSHRDLDYESGLVVDWKQAKGYQLLSIPLALNLKGQIYLVAGEQYLDKTSAAVIEGKPNLQPRQAFINGGITIYGDDPVTAQMVMQEPTVQRLAALPQILNHFTFLMIIDGGHLRLVIQSILANSLAYYKIKDLPTKLTGLCGTALVVGQHPTRIIDQIAGPAPQSPESAAAFYEKTPEEVGFADIFQQSIMDHLPRLDVWTKKIQRLRWLKKPMLWFWISLAVFLIPSLLATKHFSWLEGTRDLGNLLLSVAMILSIIVTVFLGRVFMKPVQHYKTALMDLITRAVGNFLPEVQSHGVPTDGQEFLAEMSDLGLIYKAKPYRMVYEFKGRHRDAGFHTMLMVHPSYPGAWLTGEENDLLFAVVAIACPTAVTTPLVLIKRHRQMPIHIQNRFPKKHRVTPPEPLAKAGVIAYSADSSNAGMVLADPRLEKLIALPEILKYKVVTIILDGRRLLLFSGTLAEFTILPVPASLYFVQKLAREALHDAMNPRAIIDTLAD